MQTLVGWEALGMVLREGLSEERVLLLRSKLWEISRYLNNWKIRGSDRKFIHSKKAVRQRRIRVESKKEQCGGSSVKVAQDHKVGFRKVGKKIQLIKSHTDSRKVFKFYSLSETLFKRHTDHKGKLLWKVLVVWTYVEG